MIEKDFRALLPVWLSAVAAVALSHAAGRNWEWLGVAAYFLGAPAIGAYVFGHEFTHRTTGMLLTMPVSRSRIWISKMLLAVVLVTPLTGIAMYAGPLRGGGDARAAEVALFTLTTLGGICLASWFAMLARDPLAGMVFTCGLAGMLMFVGAWIGINFYGYTKDVDNFQVLFMWATLVPLCAMGVVLGWRMFVELEARDGDDSAIHLDLPRGGQKARTARRTLSRRNPLLLLALKELRLQQLAWALAVIYVLLYVGLVLWRRDTSDVDSLAQVLTMLFSGVIAIVIGSVTTAEERQLGTLDTQWLQPAAVSQQWLVKTATALVLAGLLILVLPAALSTILPPQHLRIFGRNGIVRPQSFYATASLIAVAMYVSALSRTTLHALLASIVSLVTIGIFFMYVVLTAADKAFMATHTMIHLNGRTVLVGRYTFIPAMEAKVYFAVFAAGLILLILRFAGVNARAGDRNPRRIALQVMSAAAVAVAGFALAGALGIR